MSMRIRSSLSDGLRSALRRLSHHPPSANDEFLAALPSSPPSKTASLRVMPVRLSAARLKAALQALDTSESARINPAQAGAIAARHAEPQHDDHPVYARCSHSMDSSVENRRDNRWTDILTYDHALLPGLYLNASLIPSFPVAGDDGPRQSYIASQAPLPHTLSTFYAHIVRHRVRLIVNLTPFTEQGRRKAHEYWPLKAGNTLETAAAAEPADGADSTPATTTFTVRQMNSADKPSPKVLDDELKATRYALNVEWQDAEPWQVTVLHVTTWADFGNYPDDVFARLLTLIQQEAAVQSSETPPIWVHCSAGIGRSGTVIAAMMARDLGTSGSSLHTALKLPHDLPPADKLGDAAIDGAQRLVDHCRRFRPKMVQTREQLGMVAAVVAAELQK